MALSCPHLRHLVPRDLREEVPLYGFLVSCGTQTQAPHQKDHLQTGLRDLRDFYFAVQCLERVRNPTQKDQCPCHFRVKAVLAQPAGCASTFLPFPGDWAHHLQQPCHTCQNKTTCQHDQGNLAKNLFSLAQSRVSWKPQLEPNGS